MPARAVGERLGALDRETFVAFCAALWRVRGYDVSREGNCLVATRGDERLGVLIPATHGPLCRRAATLRSRLPTSVAGDTAVDEADGDVSVDIVVTPVESTWARRVADRHAARFVDPTALANRLLYGIPRGDAASLTSRYLGVSTSSALGTDDDATVPTSRPMRFSTTGLVVAGVVCLVLAALVGGVWAPAGSGSFDDGAPTRTPPTDRSVDAGSQAASTTAQYPPGITAESVDSEKLADAHATAVAGRSYRLITRQSGTDRLDGSHRWSGAWQHAGVAGDRTWLYTVVGYDSTPNGTRLVQYTAYADGEYVYRRAGIREGLRYDRDAVRLGSEGYGFHTDRARRAVRLYLATTRVEVDQPSWRPDLYRVVATGRPTAVGGTVSNYTATAFVSREGFVSEMTVEFTRHESDDAEDVRFRLEYAAVDETQAEPPGWYDEAKAATAANPTDEQTAANTTED